MQNQPTRRGPHTRPTTKLNARTGKTTRSAAAGRGERDGGGGRGQRPQEGDNKQMIYIGAGGAVLLLIIIAAVMSGGGGGGHGRGKDLNVSFNRTFGKAVEKRTAGDYAGAVSILEEILVDKYKSCDNWSDAQQLAKSCRDILNAERDSVSKVSDFKRRIDQAKEDQTAMKKAKEFWTECQDLLVQYGQTSQGDTLRGIREDLRRWVATESQTDWQNDYNSTKAMIKREYLDKGNFFKAVGEWKRFGETSADPLLKSRIDVFLPLNCHLSLQSFSADGSLTRIC
jgi:hypothetical protein